MKHRVLKVDSTDNVIVALEDLKAGEAIEFDGNTFVLKENIPAKHKFTEHDFQLGEEVLMYGVLVGKTTQFIAKGSRISTENIKHSASSYQLGKQQQGWIQPDISSFQGKTFNGYHRADGSVGTMNYWLVLPLVFCENRNLKVIENALLEQLGYATDRHFSVDTQHLINLYNDGKSNDDILAASIIQDAASLKKKRIFKNVDGIKFLSHSLGCGGTRGDAETLCRLFAGYITHPNVAGATVLSLGCQNAQIEILQKAIDHIDPQFQKPVFYLEQQQSKSERHFIADAVKQTFVGLIEADKVERQPAPLDKLTIGLECGGSDGFSGITANPALGFTSDLVVALGGKTILSEFPELNGVEQELINRCIDQPTAEKFAQLMESYSNHAALVGEAFENNPFSRKY